jgi:cysteinyl-tRNA synthetase
VAPQIKLFNTRTRSIEPFEPIEPGLVKLYCCGPTVYNYAHIGNLRTYFFEDSLRRMFELCGLQVRHVMNVTDVGHLQSDADTGPDKMEIAAAREKKSPWDIAKFYEAEFFRHLKMLRIERPHVICRATDHIAEMISMVECLIGKGHAYVADGNVYYDVSSFPQYGEFGQLDMSALQSTDRVEHDPRKRNQTDFVLWFSVSKYPNQIMKWESPWGTGFPGWHIECSAMATKYLGDHFDIHCGGIDHVRVHHTNEIAQSEGCRGHRWVDVWLHGEFLTIEKGKMAKSSGSFLHLDQLIADGFKPAAYRYFLLGTHYRAQIKFSYEALQGAQNALRTLRGLQLDWQREMERTPGARPRQPIIDECWSEFLALVANDLHLPQALAYAWETARRGELVPAERHALIQKFDGIFGLGLSEAQDEELDSAARLLFEERKQARHRRDWKRSDELRDQLLAMGIRVKDRANGTDWERV